MNKEYIKKCGIEKIKRKCRTCKKHSDLSLKKALLNHKHFMKHNSFKKRVKMDRKLRTLKSRCLRCAHKLKAKKQQYCNANDYIKFSTTYKK